MATIALRPPGGSEAVTAINGTPWEGAKVYLGGTAATYKDMHDGSNIDLMIAGIAAATLIFVIMLVITRSVVAAFVIVGTVLLSLGASFGLSVLLWQYILGIKLHWMVLAMAIILLLAVGSDYNLLLISRFKEEIHAGLKTGTIRAMAGSGSVVTAAGLVFAATMATFMFSPLRVMAQVGTTIALGLLFDTLIVRSFMTPSLATLLGRWFWWPQVVHPRGECLFPISDHRVRGHRNHRQVGKLRLLAKCMRGCITVHDGHPDIEQDCVGSVVLRRLNGEVAFMHHAIVVADRLQHPAHGLRDIDIVIHNKDLQRSLLWRQV